MPHFYAPMYRPPGITLPKGWELVERPRQPGTGFERREDLPLSKHPFGVISYPDPLPPDIVERQQLQPINPKPDTRRGWIREAILMLVDISMVDESGSDERFMVITPSWLESHLESMEAPDWLRKIIWNIPREGPLHAEQETFITTAIVSRLLDEFEKSK